MIPRRQRTNLTAFLTGVFVTLLVAGWYLAGGLEWVELRTLDLRFRYANTIPESPDLVCIDIDDGSLEKVGRWPWPRDEQAGMFRVLAELGARAILVDLTYSEPQPVRTEVPRDFDLLAEPRALREAGLVLRFPDEALREALAETGNAYLAVHYDPDDWDRSTLFAEAVAAVREGRSADALERERKPAPSRLRWLWRAARVAVALESNPEQDVTDLAQALGMEQAFVRQVYERCRQFVLRRYVRRALREHSEWGGWPPYRTAEALYAGLTSRPFVDETPLRAALLKAYRDVLSYEATMSRPLVSAEQVRSAAVPADAIVPVYFAHAQAARGCGFVAFEPDEDGVMRRNALLARHEGRVLPQLAFALACDVLGVRGEHIRKQGDRLVLERPADAGGPLVIQLDPHGKALMPWVPRRDWTRQFGPHIPADVLWSVQDRRRQQEHNRRLLEETRRTLFAGDLFPGHEEYRRWWARLREIEEAPSGADSRQAAELRERLAALESARVTRLQRTLAEVTTRPGAEDEAETLRFLLEQVEKLEELERQVAEADENLQREIDQTLTWLRPRVAGKICLLGYTATSLADMTPIPTHPRAPGVIAHANLLNGLLTGRLVRWAPPAVNVLLALLGGVVASLVSVRLSPRTAGWLVLLLAGGLVGAAGWWAFRTWTYWIALTPAVLAMFGSYLAISVYRYVFLDRERRELTTALSQYTSATLARQMAEDADLCRRAEEREVTAMFTDLRGFTTLSERIGAERTQRVLNVCLGRCSEIMLAHEAMVNKFIGDGIFAFWNPLIYPQPNHADLACDTALDLLAGMRALAEEQLRSGGDEAFAELVLRIGLASGRAVVGPCGSEQKYDYTCIGDTVNVAARLESANKFYGTRVLVSQGTFERVGSAFVFRPLGGVQVKGKLQVVPIYELLGRAGAVPAGRLEYARIFGEAVERFQGRDWTAARAGFEACLERQPEDLAALRYLEAIRRFQEAPPPEDWNGALELLEK